MKYHEKLAAALTERLGGGVSVHTDPSGLVVLDEDGTSARALARVYDFEVDRRGNPTAEIVATTIGRAARALSADIPKYKPEYVEPARAFVARLQGVAS